MCSTACAENGFRGTVLEERMPAMSAEKPAPAEALESVPANSDAARAASELAANRLLAGLPSEEMERVRAASVRVRARMRQVLYEQGGPMDYAYFPQDGVFSMLVEMAD